MQSYEKPILEIHGTVETLTRGEGLAGSDDQFWFIKWGTDPEDETS